uniref:Reverse transcriptase domain-containing protein n=1 Tax=Tanacetum cinerariifolium TaxID=118510 RepID=A0A6L2M3A9_TANCI|nr:reverse transcriptase domain-containing protein [Tanacetum cinerariifolium]
MKLNPKKYAFGIREGTFLGYKVDTDGLRVCPDKVEGTEFIYALRFRFNTTNNEAEYEALIVGLQIARQMGVQNLQANTDSKLRIDIAGPFPEGPRKVKFLIVTIDYFTKWIEAKPVATIMGAQGYPFKDWCEKLCISQFFTFVKHPQANVLVERANRSLGEGIKARETPFSLTYGTDAVIPVEIGMPTLRTAEVDIIKNDEALEINMDLLEERREHAAIQEAKRKAKMEKYYNIRVRSTSFRSGDLVYQSNEASRTKDGGKLGPKWEGPYEVTEALGKGLNKLRDYYRNDLPRT